MNIEKRLRLAEDSMKRLDKVCVIVIQYDSVTVTLWPLGFEGEWHKD